MTERHKHILGISLIFVSSLLLYSVFMGINSEDFGNEHAAVGIIGGIIINIFVFLLGNFGSVILFCSIFIFGLNLLLENRICFLPKLIFILSFLISITFGIVTDAKGAEFSSGIVGKHVGNVLLNLFGLAGSAVFLGVIIFSLILNHNSLFISKIRSYLFAFKNNNQHVENAKLHLKNNSLNDNQPSEYIEGEWSEV